MMVMMILFLVSLVFLIQGMLMHAQVTTEEDEFHALQAKYWILDKATRDAAPTGSELNQQLVKLQ